MYIFCPFYDAFSAQGAVQYGLDPSIVHVRRAKCTYGIGVIRPFVQVPLTCTGNYDALEFDVLTENLREFTRLTSWLCEVGELGAWTCLMSLFVPDSPSQGHRHCHCHHRNCHHCHRQHRNHSVILIFCIISAIVILSHSDRLLCRGEEVVRSYRPAQDNQVSLLMMHLL